MDRPTDYQYHGFTIRTYATARQDGNPDVVVMHKNGGVEYTAVDYNDAQIYCVMNLLPKSRSDRDWKPDVYDDNDYVYRDGYWHVYYDEHDELIAEEEDDAECAYHRSQKRAEWEHYHPGEPCPECELE